MNGSIEAQLATAWDLATDQIAKQQKQIEDLKAGLVEERGARAKMALAKQAAEVQIHQNALAEVAVMMAAETPDRDGIAERLDRVTAFLAGLAVPAEEDAPEIVLESRT